MDYDGPLFSKVYFLDNDARKMRKDFLQRFASLMKWNNGNDVVLDVGCGPGDATRIDLLPSLPEVKIIIAIDVLPYMIDLAIRRNSHPKIEYHLADITKPETLEKWTGRISKIFSMFCLQSLEDQEGAFKGIFSLLKERGEAALYFVLTSPFYFCYDDIIASPKWKKLVKDIYVDIPESHRKGYSSDYYKPVLEKVGFEVLVCEDDLVDFSFENDDIAKESLASYCSFTSSIPEEMKEEFKNDLLKSFMKCNKEGANGHLASAYRMLTLHLRKPMEYSA